MAKSLLPSAKSGALKHLELNDNFFNSEESLPALCNLIKEAIALEHLNIDSSNIDDAEKADQVIEAMVEFPGKDTLERFCWNYDAFELDDQIEELLGVLDNGLFVELETIELAETIESKSRRNELRQ